MNHFFIKLIFVLLGLLSGFFYFLTAQNKLNIQQHEERRAILQKALHIEANKHQEAISRAKEKVLTTMKHNASLSLTLSKQLEKALQIGLRQDISLPKNYIFDFSLWYSEIYKYVVENVVADEDIGSADFVGSSLDLELQNLKKNSILFVSTDENGTVLDILNTIPVDIDCDVFGLSYCPKKLNKTFNYLYKQALQEKTEKDLIFKREIDISLTEKQKQLFLEKHLDFSSFIHKFLNDEDTTRTK